MSIDTVDATARMTIIVTRLFNPVDGFRRPNGRYTRYDVEATMTNGEPVPFDDGPLRTFKALPTGEPIDVMIEPYTNTRTGERSYTVQIPKRDPRAARAEARAAIVGRPGTRPPADRPEWARTADNDLAARVAAHDARLDALERELAELQAAVGLITRLRGDAA